MIKTWSQQADASAVQTYTFGYDLADQLRTALLKNASGAGVHAYNYNYDDAGNRTSDQTDATPRTFTNNHLNQVTAQSPGGPVRFSGSITKPGTVTVAGQAAQMAPGNQFSANVTLSPGAQTVAIVGTDTASTSRTQNYSLTVGNAGSRTMVYDYNGNMTDNGAGQTYQWDAADRLLKITYTGGATTEFTYDGFSRRVKIVEKNSGGTVTSDKRFIWEGLGISEERDSSNNVAKKFYAQGQLNGSTKLFYTTDHLGSIREIVDNSGSVQARYDYDPYGKATKLSGSLDSDFLYTGHYYHVFSGLHFATYRAYDANLGRWLSRDPIGENGGINLYQYAINLPLTVIDPLGLDTYVINRKLGGGTAMPRWALVSHTLVFTQDRNGIVHTYSWGNANNTHGWSKDRPEDVVAAFDAIDKGYAEWKGDASLDKYIDRLYEVLKDPKFNHPNCGIFMNCKQEAMELVNAAKFMRDIAKKQQKEKCPTK